MDNAKVASTAQGEKAESGKTGEFSTPRPPALVNMATIEDDDERLLARIGYKQVSSPTNDSPLLSPAGTQEGIPKMVDRLLRYFHPRRPGFRPGDNWRPPDGGRTRNRRVGLADRVRDGDVHSEFR
jgi:hypothetical protein